MANSSAARERIEYLGAASLLALLRHLPWGLALPVAQFAGMVCGLAVSRWRMVADGNLRRALPELDRRQRRRIRSGVYRNLGRVALALAKLPHCSERDVRRRVELVGLQNYRDARDKGRGVLLLTAHLGNWELGALAHGILLEPMSVMARPISNSRVDGLVESCRTARGNRVIAKRRAAREVLRVLASNGTVGILADQHAAGSEGVPVTFFGLRASAHKGLAQLALRSRAAVVPALALWDPSPKRHRIEYGPEIPLVRTGAAAEDTKENTQRFQAAIEERVRAAPDQWLWIHRRWKGPPSPK